LSVSADFAKLIAEKLDATVGTKMKFLSQGFENLEHEYEGQTDTTERQW